MSLVVAIFAAPRGDTSEATEFLRVLVALRALDREVEIFEVGRGRGVLSREPRLSPDGERYAEALAEEGVRPRADGDLGAALARADAVLVVPDPDRPGTPRILRLAHGRAPDAAALEDLGRAGQVVVERAS